ncbi:MAG TPA: hypothetical protein VMQ56_01730 [Terracidiphilus sp.]|nr:hypothetical protein [Terracidiphilus sp.]
MKQTPAATTPNLFVTCTAIHLALHANGLALAVLGARPFVVDVPQLPVL